MSNVSRKDNSWSFDSEKWRNIGNNDPYSAVYAVRVKEEVQKGMYQHRGMACCVMVKVGRNQKVYFVTSSDLETDKKQADLLPCSAQKMEGCQLVVNSTVKFGPFSFLSFDRDSSPGLKRNPSLTRLDFQVPKQNLESEFEAYTMVGTKKLLKFKFKYQRVTGKYIFSASAKRKDHPEQSFKLGAPIIIKNKDVTDKHWNSRWPVVGVMGYDEKMELCPYFVTANIFDRRPVHNEGGCLVPGIDLNVTAADSRPAQSEGEHSVFGNELNATKQATSAGRSEERGAISQLASTSDSKEQATSAGRSEERGAISQLASTSDRKEQATSAGRSEERGAISQLASTSDSKEQATSAGRSEERGAISQLASTSDSKEQATSAGRSEERGAISQLASTSDSKEQATSAGRSEERGAISQLASTSDSKDGRFYYDLGMDYIISRFDFPKAIDCFEKSLDIAGKAGDQATEGKAALTLGISCQSQGNFPKAIESYEKSLNIARKTGDRAREGDDYSNLASVYESCGSLSKAIECYEKSLEISRKAGDRKREGKAYFSLGIVYDSLGDSRKASECYEKSVSITGDAGNAHDSHSDLPLAIELYKASSKVASEGGFQAGVNRANRDLANCSFACRDFSEAYTYGIEYLKTVNRVGAHTEETAERRPYNIHEQATSAGRSEERGAISQLASTSDSKEQATSAGRSEERGAISQLASTSDRKEQATSAGRSEERGAISRLASTSDSKDGRFYYDLGMDYIISRFDFPKAIDCFEKSLDIAGKAGDQATEGKAALTLGISCQSQGNFPKAIESYEKSLNIARKTGDRAREGDDYSNLASVYESCGSLSKAIECYEKSLEISRKAGDRKREGKAYFSLGIVYDSLGDSRKASECYEKSVSITGDAGNAHDSHSDLPLAIELYKASSKVASEGGFQAGVNRANRDLANCSFARRDFSEAYTYGIEYLKTVNRVGAHTEETAERRPYNIHDTSQGKADDTTFAAGSYQRFLYDMEAAKKQSKVEIKAYQQNMAQLKQNIHNAGLQMRDDIPDDGNCLFHAVADQMERLGESGYNHTDLRHLAVETLTEGNYGISKNDISKFVPNNDLSSYLTDMSRDGTWGDHIVLVALAHALSRKVVVVSSLVDSQNVVVEPDNHHGEPILLGHLSEIHYVSLEPMDV
ncbi:tetratricopeptide repeat protein 28-like isoform X3 [Montipora foliosa]|uniref:tetratricopeptide repeat protein 28-like isoform X3 n=1 Tax=Montipora foliosa TaxID=591990 RepID=UPI0035F1CD90